MLHAAPELNYGPPHDSLPLSLSLSPALPPDALRPKWLTVVSKSVVELARTPSEPSLYLFDM